jgi:hypothetical protein
MAPHQLDMLFKRPGQSSERTCCVTGLELDDQGAVHPLDPDLWWQRRAELSKNGGPPEAVISERP